MRAAINKSRITSFWKKELPELNRPQIASSVLAFLTLATMMTHGTEVITETIEQKKEYWYQKRLFLTILMR